MHFGELRLWLPLIQVLGRREARGSFRTCFAFSGVPNGQGSFCPAWQACVRIKGCLWRAGRYQTVPEERVSCADGTNRRTGPAFLRPV